MGGFIIIEAARKGQITPEMEYVAKAEGIDPQKIRKLVASGRVVIPKNISRNTIPVGIGEFMSVKVNANVGTSKDFIDIKEELKKALMAVQYGADTIMDLSTGGDFDDIRRIILESIKVPVGSVPIYQAARDSIADMTSDDMFNAVRKHAEDGIDFVTIHAGVTLDALEQLKKSDRILNVVSRGGAFTIAWMIHNQKENPFYEEYDYLLEIAHEHNLTISLGDGMRPGCIADASDRPEFMEFMTLGELAREARRKGVQTLVEGPGHVPLEDIDLSVRTMKSLTNGAPLYLLGPLVTDIAPGYDHITGAIGGSVAGMHGADFLCMTSPSEHLSLPTVEDVKEGTIVTKIAAHIADLVRIKDRAKKMDDQMAVARKNLDWEKQFELSIDPERARRIKCSRRSKSDACSMCGELCAIKIIKDALR
ncbi:MAG: phosphomethylpyrimidine synthase ThiC [Methanocellales archaeon]|nr:phosphomethylpyrimidine synthase ThiC [Methanocellales archaeon]